MVTHRHSIIDSNKWDPVEPFVVYVHSNRDEHLAVELTDEPGGKLRKQRFPKEVHETLHYLGYEIALLYYVNMTTGKATLTAARENGQWLTAPGEPRPSEEDVRRGKENGAL